MARCGCTGSNTCTCAIIEGDGIDITGTGSSGDPYIISFDPLSGGGVITGDQADSTGTSISSTDPGPGSSNAAGVNSVAIGQNTIARSPRDTALGYGAQLEANTDDSIAISSFVGHDSINATAIQNATIAPNSDYATGIGNGSLAGAAGTVAIGTDDTGAGAQATVVNDYVFGTARHTVKTPGKLQTAAGVAGKAPLQVQQGVAPTAPIDGDIWTTIHGIYGRINGTTVGPFASEAVFDVHNPDYGAKGDGVTDDTTAIQAAIDAAAAVNGGVVQLRGDGRTYRAGGVVLKSGVLLVAAGSVGFSAGGKQTCTITPPSGWAGGWMIDTPATTVQACGVVGITISGGIVSAGSPNTGGIQFQNVSWGVIAHCSVGATSLGSIKVTGLACRISNNSLQNFWNYRTPLSSDEGVLWVTGTDHIITHNQVNGGRVLATAITSTNVTLLHEIANLITGQAIWMEGGNGEFSELAYKIQCNQSSFTDIRADTNPGPGILVVPYVTQLDSNLFTGVKALANNLATNARGVMSAIYCAAFECAWVNVEIGPDWTGGLLKSKYGITDSLSMAGYNAPAIRRYRNRYRNIVVSDLAVTRDWIDPAGNAISFEKSGAGASNSRSPSRWSAGENWWDSSLAKMLISTGAAWVDSTGANLGNLFPAEAADGYKDTLRWDPYTTTATLSLEDSGILVQPFFRPCAFKVVCTAAGVATTFCGAVTQAAYCAPVVAGQNYKVGIQAVGPNGKSSTCSVLVNWLTAGGVFISTTNAILSGAIAAQPTQATELVSGTIAAPATAAFAQFSVLFADTTLATGDTFWFALPTIVSGTVLPGPLEA